MEQNPEYFGLRSRRAAFFKNMLIQKFHLAEKIGSRIQIAKATCGDLAENHELINDIMKESPDAQIKYSARNYRKVKTSRSRRIKEVNALQNRAANKFKLAEQFPVREWVRWLTKHQRFIQFYCFLVVWNMIALAVAIDHGEIFLDDSDAVKLVKSVIHWQLTIAETSLGFIMIFELIMKWVYDFLAFWKKLWNWIDFFVVCVTIPLLGSIFDWYELPQLHFTVFQSLRTLVALKLVHEFNSMKAVFELLALTLLSMVYVSGFIVIMTYLMGLIASLLFDTHTVPHGTITGDLDEIDLDRGWRAELVFSYGLGRSVLIIFKLFTLDGWYRFYKQFIQYHDVLASSLFIFSWVFLSAFLLGNLFPALLISNFQRIRSKLMEEIKYVEAIRKFSQEIVQLGDEIHEGRDLKSAITSQEQLEFLRRKDSKESQPDYVLHTMSVSDTSIHTSDLHQLFINKLTFTKGGTFHQRSPKESLSDTALYQLQLDAPDIFIAEASSTFSPTGVKKSKKRELASLINMLPDSHKSPSQKKSKASVRTRDAVAVNLRSKVSVGTVSGLAFNEARRHKFTHAEAIKNITQETRAHLLMAMKRSQESLAADNGNNNADAEETDKGKTVDKKYTRNAATDRKRNANNNADEEQQKKTAVRDSKTASSKTTGLATLAIPQLAGTSGSCPAFPPLSLPQVRSTSGSGKDLSIQPRMSDHSRAEAVQGSAKQSSNDARKSSEGKKLTVTSNSSDSETKSLYNMMKIFSPLSLGAKLIQRITSNVQHTVLAIDSGGTTADVADVAINVIGATPRTSVHPGAPPQPASADEAFSEELKKKLLLVHGTKEQEARIVAAAVTKSGVSSLSKPGVKSKMNLLEPLLARKGQSLRVVRSIPTKARMIPSEFDIKKRPTDSTGSFKTAVTGSAYKLPKHMQRAFLLEEIKRLQIKQEHKEANWAKTVDACQAALKTIEIETDWSEMILLNFLHALTELVENIQEREELLEIANTLLLSFSDDDELSESPVSSGAEFIINEVQKPSETNLFKLVKRNLLGTGKLAAAKPTFSAGHLRSVVQTAKVKMLAARKEPEENKEARKESK